MEDIPTEQDTMADTAPSQWDPQEFNNIQFDIEAAQHQHHIPRAWERVPKSSHATRHKGRTVWKRSETRIANNNGTGNTEAAHQIACGNERLALGDISTNTPRGIKKLRLQNKQGDEELDDETAGDGEKVKRYVVTSRESGFDSTPKRKQRNVRKSGLFPTIARNRNPRKSMKRQSIKVDSPKVIVRPEVPMPIESTEEVASAEETISIEKDQAMEGEAAEQEVDQISKTEGAISPVKILQETTTDLEIPTSPEKASSPTKDVHAGANSVSPRKRGRPRKSVATPLPFKFVGNSTPAAFEPEIVMPNETEHATTDDTATPMPRKNSFMTPRNNKSLLASLPTPTPRLMDLNSPQIGTTLLRRESMRRKSSPGKRLSAKAKTPKKKQLKKRDTLQERDILQKFSEEEASQTVSQELPLPVGKAEAVLDPDSPALGANDVQVVDEPLSDSRAEVEAIAEEILDNKDLQRAVEAIEVCQDVETSESGGSLSPKSSEEMNLAEANEAIANVELNEAHETIIEVCEKADLPLRKTRSGIRFSDDTSMLKDFLSRAQANKAAKTTALSPKVPKSLQVSPKRSPRKRSGPTPLAKPQTSMVKARSAKLKASPNKAKLEMTFGDDLEAEGAAIPEPKGELEPDAVTCRRSTRARLLTPKTPPSGPSLIPVRRADGADPVVLQKTQAQELAIATRANTRRNKGQARPPQMALRDLSADDGEDSVMTDKPETRRGTGKGKTVAWAETLAHYQGAKELPENEEKPKVRRLRGLGGANGTPAAKKKTASAAPSNGTPAPKRRAKLTG